MNSRFRPDLTGLDAPLMPACAAASLSSGETFGNAWSVSSCGARDYVGWQWAAEDWAAANGYDITGYRHRVVITRYRKGWHGLEAARAV
jgi:hypothetical protein